MNSKLRIGSQTPTATWNVSADCIWRIKYDNHAYGMPDLFPDGLPAQAANRSIIAESLCPHHSVIIRQGLSSPQQLGHYLEDARPAPWWGNM